MVSPPVCPKCGSLGIGETCATCGAQMRPPPAAADMLGVSVPGLKLDGVDDTGPAPGVIAGGARHRTASAYLSLEPSETAVLHAASRIFAGYVSAGLVNDGNEKELSDRSVRLAARMAIVIERYIQSDNEDW